MQKRKSLRLTGWDYSQAAVYFVTICTQDKARLLGSIVGGGVLDAPHIELSPAGQTVERRLLEMERTYEHVSLPAYVLMPNHIHFLLVLAQMGTSGTPSPTNRGLPAFISAFKRLTNRDCGKALWQRSYYDHIIRDETDFLLHARYISENPQKWREDEYYALRVT